MAYPLSIREISPSNPSISFTPFGRPPLDESMTSTFPSPAFLILYKTSGGFLSSSATRPYRDFYRIGFPTPDARLLIICGRSGLETRILSGGCVYLSLQQNLENPGCFMVR